MSFLSKLVALLVPDIASQVSPADAKRALASPNSSRPLLVDVRTSGEWKQGRIAGARHADISSGDFDTKVGAIPRGANILLYCQSGARSRLAMSRMRELGFTSVKHVSGGMGSWRSAGFPVAK